MQSVVIEPIYSNLDNNPNAGGGLRIFPDKLSPTGVARRKVRLKATLNNSASNIEVRFRSFDIDDPSTDNVLVDDTGPGPGDNKGRPYSGTLSSTFANTVNGVATVEFEANMNPGDNFVIAASTDIIYLNGISEDGLNLRDTSGNILPTTKAKRTEMLTVWREVHVEVDSMGTVTDNYLSGVVTGTSKSVFGRAGTNVYVAPSLEFGRFNSGRMLIGSGFDLRVSSNTNYSVFFTGRMFVNSINLESFTLYDDDDYNGSDGTALDGDVGEDVNELSETLSLMQDSDDPDQNIFAVAYIRPEYDWAIFQNYNTNNIPFNLNVANNSTAISTQLSLGQNSLDDESSDFWIVYIQLGYQGDVNIDSDPNSENGIAGTGLGTSLDLISSCSGVPKGGNGSLVYLEAARDVEENTRTPQGNITLPFKKKTAPHEVGHQFGLRGDNVPGSGSDPTDYGIMSYSAGLFLAPQHINILRCRVKSPGQL